MVKLVLVVLVPVGMPWASLTTVVELALVGLSAFSDLGGGGEEHVGVQR